MFVFAPLPGTAMTGAMCTHAGVCCIGINVDGEVFEQPERLWAAMERSMAEVLVLGGAGGDGDGVDRGGGAQAGAAANSRRTSDSASPASNIG
jgi:hypothetical protein